MHKRRLAWRDIRPEQGVFQLEFDYTGDCALRFSKEEQAGFNFGGEARGGQLVIAPHRHPTLLQPVRCLSKYADYFSSILWQSLSDDEAHRES